MAKYRRHTGCFKKSSHETFWNIFTLVKSFSVKFLHICWQFISTNFCRFILIFHQMALMFPRVPTFSPCQVLSIHP